MPRIGSSRLQPKTSSKSPHHLTLQQQAAASCAVQMSIAASHRQAALARRSFHSWSLVLLAAEAGARRERLKQTGIGC
jgi:uncharacterized membrane protein YhhN